MNAAITAITALSALVTLLGKLGLNVRAVSEAVLQAHEQGETLSDAKLESLAQGWRATDVAEQDAYEKRMERDDPKT